MRNLILSTVLVFLSACSTTPPGAELLPPEAAEVLAAAKAGDAQAMEVIGEAFHYGTGGVNRSLATAFRWYEAAAKAGLASSQDYVGLFYAGGLGGVKEDCAQSIHWFMLAAKNGNVESKNNAAWMLATCPDSRHRDGQRAVQLAEEAIQSLGRQAGYVSTLAAAYAEVGDFVRAMELQEESIWLMRGEGATASRLAEAEVRMARFRDRKPWRGASYVDAEAFRPQ
jgi:uncharacterized protein